MSAYNTSVFTSYINNPYEFLNKKQKAAVLVFSRKSRFVTGYNINEHLRETLLKFFGNENSLIETGLVSQYNLLKNYVEENNLIGLILYGANVNNVNTELQHISKYLTKDKKIINLEVTTLCERLLNEYFVDEEYINTLCEKTPNFEIYYNSL